MCVHRESGVAHGLQIATLCKSARKASERSECKMHVGHMCVVGGGETGAQDER